MATELFVKAIDLKRESVLSGNIDDNKLRNFMNIAHETHVRNLMGTDLFDRIRAGITAADLTTGADSETSLLNDYIKPLTIHWCLVEVLGFLPYTGSNKGMFKHNSENADTMSKEEVDGLVQKHRNIAQSYSRRFVDYMCYNESSFPQYTSNTDEDVKPSTSTDFGGWVL